MSIEIDSITHPLMLLTRELLGAEGRTQHAKFIIDDVENIQQAMSAGLHIESVFLYGEHIEKQQDFLQTLPAATEVCAVRPRTCKKIFAHDKIARVFAIAKIPAPVQLIAIDGDLAVLDGLVMAGNVGAIIRSALAFGVGGLVLLDTNYDFLYDRRLIRASKGYLFKLPVVCLTQQEFLTHCQRQGLKLVACHQNATVDFIEEVATPAAKAWVLGAEKTGVTPAMLQAADAQVTIPFNTQVESLNVSVAAAIVFFARYQARQSQIAD